MSAFAKKLVERNYGKRILAILIAAGILLLATAIFIPTTLHKQIAELRALERTQEQHEDAISENVTEGQISHKPRNREQEIRAVFHQLTPISISTKVIFVTVALLAFLIGAFYWITVAEWLYKIAVRNNLNRALWPMLGLLCNLLVLPALLIVLCDPQRARKQVL